ncbi:MAG: ORF6N domain-containing protein [Candidatus Binatia bacterium]
MRGKRVMLNSELVSINGVETKALNRAVKRNRNRF